MADPRGLTNRLSVNISSVIVGNTETIQRIIECFICGGHVLIEDDPGVGKTLTAESMAHSCNMSYARVQGAPDLMPSDITGANVWLPGKQEFEFRPGPIFGNIVVADEINRINTKSQAVFLEAMQEGQVTVDGETRTLPDPFFVMATQNPLESDGVFPLSEANIDRFAVRLPMEGLTQDQLAQVFLRTELGEPRVEPVLYEVDFKNIRKEYEEVRVHPLIRRYVAELIEAAQQPERLGYEFSRKSEVLHYGNSSRAGQWLIRLSKAAAIMEGSWFVSPEYVRERLYDVLNHRLRGNDMQYGEERLAQIREEFVPRLLNSVKHPDVTDKDLMAYAEEKRNN